MPLGKSMSSYQNIFSSFGSLMAWEILLNHALSFFVIVFVATYELNIL